MTDQKIKFLCAVKHCNIERSIPHKDGEKIKPPEGWRAVFVNKITPRHICPECVRQILLYDKFDKNVKTEAKSNGLHTEG